MNSGIILISGSSGCRERDIDDNTIALTLKRRSSPPPPSSSSTMKRLCSVVGDAGDAGGGGGVHTLGDRRRINSKRLGGGDAKRVQGALIPLVSSIHQLSLLVWSVLIGSVTAASRCHWTTQYLSNETCCEKCLPGQLRVSPCNATSPTVCEPCPENSYSPVHSSVHRCMPCKHCNKAYKQLVTGPCSPMEDTRCGCGEGTYKVLFIEKGSRFWCCPNCRPGHEVTKKCSDMDFLSECSPCPAGSYSSGFKCNNCTRCDVEASPCSEIANAVCATLTGNEGRGTPLSPAAVAGIVAAAVTLLVLTILTAVLCPSRLCYPLRQSRVVGRCFGYRARNDVAAAAAAADALTQAGRRDTRQECKVLMGDIGTPEANCGCLGNGEANCGCLGNGEANGSCLGNGEANDGCLGNREDNDSCLGNGEANDGCLGNGEANDGCLGNREANDGCLGNGEANDSCLSNAEANDGCLGNGEANDGCLGN
ncbi:uncharacterized protein LOC116956594 isoform X2 [Petromyzon marinus]|uniref:Uncharacterized protein LOC116956594 isoform X2 n=1 Tax=Petromyzon marinus TaxID=7757 RepID=A0AAJ7UEB7_PETMA|nr:uncharacterized protein LOC116956594 isoform X2 [Petromyzon marinus]